MGALANAFALLGDQQGKEASTIVALKTAEVQKIAEKKKKKKVEAKKKKSSVRDGGLRGKEGHGHAQEILDGNAVEQRFNGHQRNEPSDGLADSPVPLKAKGNTGDGQANQEHKVVVSVRTVVTEKERKQEEAERSLAREKERRKEEAEHNERSFAREAELAREAERYLARKAERKEQYLAREAKRKEQLIAREAELAREAERKARCLAREAEREEQRLAREEEKKKEIEERRKKEMSMKTLKEYEDQKAFEKQKAEKVTLSVPETPPRESTHEQKSKDETIEKDSNIKKHRKVRKTMNIEEFRKLPPTGREGQDGKGGVNIPDEDHTALDLSETSFPVLDKVRKGDTY